MHRPHHYHPILPGAQEARFARRPSKLTWLAGILLFSWPAAKAQEASKPNVKHSLNRYTQQQELDSIRAWQSQKQLTSLDQFVDLQPSSWAYQALGNLIARYGCMAGLPGETFKGNRAITRFEAAALLNACLDQVSEHTDELQQLLKALAPELKVVAEKSEHLENRTSALEAQQFATTTRLNGEAYMMLAGIPGYKVAGDSGYGATTFNYDIRLNFDTSYTGQDLLRVRLNTSNFSTYPFGTPANNMLKLDKAENWNSTLYIDRFYYILPISKQAKIVIGALVNNTEITWVPSAYRSDILDYVSTAGANGVYNKATGEGLALQWQQPNQKNGTSWIANMSYVVNGRCGLSAGSGNGGCGAISNYGVLNSNSGINAFAQLGMRHQFWGATIGYRHGTSNSTFRDGNSAAGTTLTSGQSSNSVSINGYWQPRQTGWFPSISAGYGYTFVSGTPTNGAEPQDVAQASRSWMAAFQWDKTFCQPHTLGVAIGQPANASGPQGSSPWLWEFFYKIQASDNISITPELFYVSNASVTTGNGANQPTGWNGWGGVIQVAFKF